MSMCIKRRRYPNGLPIDDSRRTGDNDTDERSQRETDGDCKQLRPKGISGLLRESSKIRIIDNQSGKVRNTIHNRSNDRPRLRTSRNRRTLMNDRSNPPRLDNRPNHKENARHGNSIRFDSKQMTNLVHGEPNSRQRT